MPEVIHRCPYCGAVACGTRTDSSGEVISWGHTCLLRQIAALCAENARLRAVAAGRAEVARDA